MTEVAERVVTPTVEPAAPCVGPEFERFVSTHAGRLRRHLAPYVPPADADDVAQEALIRVMSRWDRLEGRDPWPWLAVVARNLALDLIRSRRVCDVAQAADAADVQEWTSVPEQRAISQECAGILERALETLTPHQQQLVRLKGQQGKSLAEIADLYGMTQAATRQQLFRARRALKAAFQAAGGSLPAVTPLGALLAGGNWLRRHLREFGTGLVPAASIGALVIAVVTVVLPALQGPDAAAGTSGTARTTMVEPAAVPAAEAPAAVSSAPVAVAPTGGGPVVGLPVTPPSAPRDVVEPTAALPITPSMSADVAPRPWAPEAWNSAEVTVETPLTTVKVETHLRNGPAGPVCEVTAGPCS